MIFIDANNVPYTPNKFLSYDDLLLVPKFSNFSSRKDPRIKLGSKVTSKFGIAVPILSAPMDTVTGADMAIALAKQGGIGILHRFYNSEELFLSDVKKVLESTKSIAFSIGASSEDINKVEKVLGLAGTSPVIVCIDVAHGHSKACIDQITRLKSRFGSRIEIMAGSIATAVAAQELIMAGADAIRVGIGGGSLCTTRLVTGHGVPNITAIIQCRMAVNALKRNTAIIAGGGIRNSGDIIKALAAGADCVMCGQIFAATQESAGPILNRGEGIGGTFYEEVNDDTSQLPTKGWYKKYRGQSSAEFNDSIGKIGVAPEGESTFIPYKGSVAPIFEQLVMGLRSGMTYAGCSTLEDLSEYATFIEITTNGYIESTPHALK